MKQYLWILNSLLVLVFGFTLLLTSLLKQEAPPMRKEITPIEKIEKKKLPIAISLERIYQHDIFDTYIPEEKRAIKEDLLKPIPEMLTPPITPPPAPPKQEFIAPLNIKLDGIISSDQEDNNVAMIADETNKEKIYRLADRIKDGQVLKISRNNVVILRANGQQEIFLLRKEIEEPKKWDYILKKIDENSYQIDPREFTKQIDSFGQFIEDFFLGISYQDNKPIGIKIGKLQENDIATRLGLKENDIILSVNNIQLSEPKNRVNIYDRITEMTFGDSIKVELKRNNQDQIIDYKLKRIERPSELFFTQPAKETEAIPEFKLSREQEREKRIRDFEKLHKKPNHAEIIADIRKRLLQNMKQRIRDRRVR